MSNLEVTFVFLSNSKSRKSKQMPAQQLTKVNYPLLFCCQYPAGIVSSELLEPIWNFLLTSHRYQDTINSVDNL